MGSEMAPQPLAGNERFIPVAPEFFVRDVAASVAFYQRLGFAVLRQEPDFAVVGLGEAHVLLADARLAGTQLRDASAPRGLGVNVRIMVEDVDAMRERAAAVGAPVVHEIADRSYGLRDFIMADPDGFLLRFAAPAWS
jgi:catechol 2,3-dioxygenase-like lactoylglutathione lyase family enzyme